MVSRLEQKHTNREWLRFLKQIDKETPKELDLHLIVDNYSTHKHSNVKEWLIVMKILSPIDGKPMVKKYWIKQIKPKKN